MKAEALITIDGPTASGKSSLGRELAKKLNWKWLSTGVFYRGFAYLSLSKKLERKNMESTIVLWIKEFDWRVCLTDEGTRFVYNEKDITDHMYTNEIDERASEVARFPLVREALLPAQRDCFEENTQGLVVEGRDCGTAIFPEAPLKIYLWADNQVRAKRRISQRNDKLSLSQVITLHKERDEQDTSREKNPLMEPEGAMIIDTGKENREKMLEKAYKRSIEVFRPLES